MGSFLQKIAVLASKPLGNLYHFIAVHKLAEALKSGNLIPHGGSQPMDMKKKYLSYKNDRGEAIFQGVSTTRNPTWKPTNIEHNKDPDRHYWAKVRLTFDGAKISSRYKVKSYNDFWKDEMYPLKKRDEDGFYAQAEEKIITDKHGVRNFLKYVTAVEALEGVRAEFEKEIGDRLGDIPVTFVKQFSGTAHKVNSVR